MLTVTAKPKAKLIDRKEPCEPLLNTDCATAPQPNTCTKETEGKPCPSNAKACDYYISSDEREIFLSFSSGLVW